MGRNGLVADETYNGEPVQDVRALLKHIQGDSEVEGTTIMTIGEKGYDGFLYAVSSCVHALDHQWHGTTHLYLAQRVVSYRVPQSNATRLLAFLLELHLRSP